MISVVLLVAIISLKILDIHVDESLEQVFVYFVQSERTACLQDTSCDLRKVRGAKLRQQMETERVFDW